MKSPISWYGGKFYIADRIARLIPKHDCYIEVFGGAAHVLFRKKPSRIEVYNDIHDGLVSFFRVIKDKEKLERLLGMIELSVFARSEHLYLTNLYKNNYSSITDDVDKAFVIFYLIKSSFNSVPGSTFSVATTRSSSAQLFNLLDIAKALNKRLRTVTVESLDFRDLIDRYVKSEDVVLYLDPPYILSSRSKTDKVYEHEISDNDHIELLNILKGLNCKWILSGYHSEIYNRELSEFERIEIEVPKFAQYRQVENHTKDYATEVIWTNFTIPKQLSISLFSEIGIENGYQEMEWSKDESE